MNNPILIMNLGLVLITFIVFIVLTRKAKMKEDREFMLKQQKKLKVRFSKYYNNLLLRKRFRRIVEMYSSLSCYDSETVKMEAVKIFERNVIITLCIPVVCAVVMQEITVTILGIVVAMVYYESVIEKEMDKLYVSLMTESSMMFTSCREKYLETDNIPLAVMNCDKSKYLEVPMNNIYRILTDTDGKEKLAKFQHSYPVAILKTFANTCYIVNENGAVKRENGSDSFAEDMIILRQECDTEIRRLTKQKIAFNSLQMLTLIGLIIMPVAEIYLLTQIPGTSVLLNGFYGLCVHTAIMGSTIYAYHYIATVNRPSVVNQIDKIQFIDDLAGNKRVYDFVKELMPKKYKTRKQLDLLIQDSLSSKDLRYIYTAKPIFAVVGFIGALLILALGTITIKDSFYNNYNSLSFIPQTVTETQARQIKLMDDEFMKLSQAEYEAYDDAKLQKYVGGRIQGIGESDVINQAKRLRTKYETYHAAGYAWWWWLVAYGVGAVGWFMPEFSLKQRKKLVQYEATNDVSQLQTMMIVLSETKMDVYKAICWLEKQATVHKAAIRKCHYSYQADPMKALSILEKMSPINDFKRIVRKLKASVYTLSLHESFSDMALDKAQSLTITEMLRNEELESRKNSSKMIAIIPAGLALVGCFIGPVLILGIQEMMETFAQLGNL